MFKFETTVLNSEGQPIPGATVSILAAGTNTLVQLYEDDQTSLKTNPLTADTTGLVQCKAANGKYDYLVGNLPGGATRRINGVIFDDPSEAGNAGIALAMPGELTVSGSPGANITVTKKTQAANTFYRGPKTGVAAAPTFDTIVIEDLPVSSQSQAEGGSNATTVMTPQRTAQAVAKQAMLKPVVSSDLSFSAGALLTLTHNFGAKPSASLLEAVCVTADAGYAANDIVDLTAGGYFSNNSNVNFNVYYDASNVNSVTSVRCGSGGFVWSHKTTGNATAITATSWRLRIKAVP